MNKFETQFYEPIQYHCINDRLTRDIICLYRDYNNKYNKCTAALAIANIARKAAFLKTKDEMFADQVYQSALVFCAFNDDILNHDRNFDICQFIGRFVDSAVVTLAGGDLTDGDAMALVTDHNPVAMFVVFAYADFNRKISQYRPTKNFNKIDKRLQRAHKFLDVYNLIGNILASRSIDTENNKFV